MDPVCETRKRLRAWRQKKGLTLEAFAALVGYSPQSLAYVETGKRNPGLDLAIKIEDRTGIKARSWIAQ